MQKLTDGNINVITAKGTRVITLDEIIKEYNINTDLWEAINFKPNVRETPISNKATGEITIVQNHQSKADFIRKKPVEVETLESVLSKYEPPKREGKEQMTSKGDLLWVHNYFDAHIDKLDTKNTKFKDKIGKQLRTVLEANKKVVWMWADETMLVVGWDYYNTDHDGKTTKGTVQMNSINEQDAWKYGIDHLVTMVDKMAESTPVTVRLIPWNHDREKLKYLNTVLEYIFGNHINVKVKGWAEWRQYHRFGSNLLMYHHWHFIKDKDLLWLIHQENNLWGVKYIEANKGHSHTYKVEDVWGAKSITNPAVWSVNHRGKDLWVGKDHEVLVSNLYDKKYGKEATLFTSVK